MNILNNLTLKIRLIGLVSLAALSLLGVGLLAVNATHVAEISMGELYKDRLIPAVEIDHISELMQESRAQLLYALQHEPGSETSPFHKHAVTVHLKKVDKQITEMFEILDHYKSSGSLDADEKTLADELSKSLQVFVDEGLKPPMGMISEDAYLKAAIHLARKTVPAFTNAHKVIEDIQKRQLASAEATYQEGVARDLLVQKIVIGAVVAAIAVLALFAYLTIRGIVDVMAKLSSAADQMSNGNLTARCEYRAPNELGNISSLFDRVGEKFRGVVREITDSAVQLASATEETSTITKETHHQMHRQKSETEQVATAMNEMVATVQEIARNASAADQAAQEADVKAREGMDVTAKALSATRDLAGEIEQAATIISDLETESSNIGSVLEVIQGIAEQTNLLALNAAIEAARAGEQGRGFAVVADEVRTLAGRTQGSTQEIQGMIERLQQGAKSAVKAMEEGQSMARNTLGQVELSDQALNAINQAVDSIKQMNAQTASAAEEQGSVAEEINRNLIAINDLSEQSANGAEQTAEASTEQARLASNLQEMAGRYTV